MDTIFKEQIIYKKIVYTFWFFLPVNSNEYMNTVLKYGLFMEV